MALRESEELAEYRGLMDTPSEFHDGFGWKTVVGALFTGFVMMPGSIYLGLVVGQSMGPAAEWTTIILFTDPWLSPIAEFARHVLVSTMGTPSAFESQVAATATVEYNRMPATFMPAIYRHGRCAARLDFALDPVGVPCRRREREVVPYLFAGVQLMHPRLMDGMPTSAFSTNRAWDKALEAGRLRAVVHDGHWFHLSTPPDLAAAEEIMQAPVTGDARWPWR